MKTPLVKWFFRPVSYRLSSSGFRQYQLDTKAKAHGQLYYLTTSPSCGHTLLNDICRTDVGTVYGTLLPFPSTKLIQAICRSEATIQSKYSSVSRTLSAEPYRSCNLPSPRPSILSSLSSQTKPSQTKPFPLMTLLVHAFLGNVDGMSIKPPARSVLQSTTRPITTDCGVLHSPFLSPHKIQHTTKAAVTTPSALRKRKTEI